LQTRQRLCRTILVGMRVLQKGGRLPERMLYLSCKFVEHAWKEDAGRRRRSSSSWGSSARGSSGPVGKSGLAWQIGQLPLQHLTLLLTFLSMHASAVFLSPEDAVRQHQASGAWAAGGLWLPLLPCTCFQFATTLWEHFCRSETT
jgi:hypothetical protein